VNEAEASLRSHLDEARQRLLQVEHENVVLTARFDRLVDEQRRLTRERDQVQHALDQLVAMVGRRLRGILETIDRELGVEKVVAPRGGDRVDSEE
jgi:SMC interacting uncharacterized protein involved in chromosome segregation